MNLLNTWQRLWLNRDTNHSRMNTNEHEQTGWISKVFPPVKTEYFTNNLTEHSRRNTSNSDPSTLNKKNTKIAQNLTHSSTLNFTNISNSRQMIIWMRNWDFEFLLRTLPGRVYPWKLGDCKWLKMSSKKFREILKKSRRNNRSELIDRNESE